MICQFQHRIFISDRRQMRELSFPQVLSKVCLNITPEVAQNIVLQASPTAKDYVEPLPSSIISRLHFSPVLFVHKVTRVA